MLMPAHPKVGDVFRSENIPGLVFEEDTVTATDITARGPRGQVPGSVRIHERPTGDDAEDKTYGPQYGEMIVDADDEKSAVTVAVPTDAAAPPPPATVNDALNCGLDGLSASGQGGRPARDRAIQSALAATDGLLPYRPVARVDVVRMDVWARAVVVDVVAGDRDAVSGDLASLGVVRDRVVGGLDPADAGAVDAGVRALRAAAGKVDVGGTAETAARLRSVLEGLAANG